MAGINRQAIDVAIEHPDLTATALTTGVKSGVPGGTTLAPGGKLSIPGTPAAQAAANSPITTMQARFRPPVLVDFAQQLQRSPADASRNLDTAVLRSYENSYRLETMIACTQHGAASVTGSAIAIPTGLASIRSVTASIDNGSTPHNLTISATPSNVPGAIDIHVFQPASKTDNTPANGTIPVLVRWTAVGGLGTN